MHRRRTFVSSALAIGISAVAAGSAISQGMMGGGQGTMGPGMMRPEMMQGGDRGASGSGTMQGGSNQEMMSRPNMMGGTAGMPCPMMGAMVQSETSASGMGALFGVRVVPKMNLSAGDVRSYLSSRLDSLGNKRLKVGNVSADGGTITADIVTADNSLVQRMKVDVGTGAIQYVN
jgi:hypothetical protein